MTHLTPDELIDAVEGLLDGDRRLHLEGCPQCQAEVAQLAATFREAGGVDVPEPSPLFWDHFSARVRAAVDAETAPDGWAAWWRWPVLIPLAAMALIVAALVVTVPRRSGPSPAAQQAPPAASVRSAPDESWELVADMVGEIDWDTAFEAGLGVQPGVADRAALDLDAHEQEALRQILKAELARAKSS